MKENSLQKSAKAYLKNGVNTLKAKAYTRTWKYCMPTCNLDKDKNERKG